MVGPPDVSIIFRILLVLLNQTKPSEMEFQMIGSSRDTEKKQMTESTITSDWGMHLNESMYFMYCPPCPKWATAWESEKWHRLGVVVWDVNVRRVAHLRGREALDQLFYLRQIDTWKREGLLVGEFAYSVTIPDNTKPKKKN